MLFFFPMVEGIAQKILEKTWNAATITTLEITSDEIFRINVTTIPTETIVLKTRVEGEYAENVVLTAFEEEKRLSISTGFSPYYQPKNDKLAAHKVLSIEMDLLLPEGKSVWIKGAIVSVETFGAFENLTLLLRTGNCVLRNFSGNGTIGTWDGNIEVFAQKGVYGTGKTEHGNVVNELWETGIFKLQAQSVNGDITLLKSQ